MAVGAVAEHSLNTNKGFGVLSPLPIIFGKSLASAKASTDAKASADRSADKQIANGYY
ncbi:MAG: hypothetical protein HYW38_01620 [Candidatus Colwellbacteria bacterium]|nr:hypothetical protein [Candidatus Colwellbacteria bacterium]